MPADNSHAWKLIGSRADGGQRTPNGRPPSRYWNELREIEPSIWRKRPIMERTIIIIHTVWALLPRISYCLGTIAELFTQEEATSNPK